MKVLLLIAFLGACSAYTPYGASNVAQQYQNQYGGNYYPSQSRFSQYLAQVLNQPRFGVYSNDYYGYQPVGVYDQQVGQQVRSQTQVYPSYLFNELLGQQYQQGSSYNQNYQRYPVNSQRYQVNPVYNQRNQDYPVSNQQYRDYPVYNQRYQGYPVSNEEYQGYLVYNQVPQGYYGTNQVYGSRVRNVVPQNVVYAY